MGKLPIRDRLILERAKQLGVPELSDAEVEARAKAELRAEAEKAIAALEPIPSKTFPTPVQNSKTLKGGAASTTSHEGWSKEARNSKAASCYWRRGMPLVSRKFILKLTLCRMSSQTYVRIFMPLLNTAFRASIWFSTESALRRCSTASRR